MDSEAETEQVRLTMEENASEVEGLPDDTSVEIVEQLTAEEIVSEMVEEVELPEINIAEEKPVEEVAKKKPVFKSAPIKVEPKPEEKAKEVEQSEIPTEEVEKPKPAKTIDFEITNPDDIKIDDKGQLGFF